MGERTDVLVVERGNIVPRCSDFDADCEDVPDKLHCYLYDPIRGYCPYLSANPLKVKE